MSQIDFQEQNDFKFKSRTVLGDYRKPGLVNWMQRKGIVKSDKAAQFILVAVIIICLGLAGFIFAGGFGFGQSNVQQLTPEEIDQLPPEIQVLYR